jgi:hypothetical protein
VCRRQGVDQDSPQRCQEMSLKTGCQAKLMILKYLTCKSFKFKDLIDLSLHNSMIPKDRGYNFF